MTEDRTQTQQSPQDQATNDASVATRPDQLMTERLLLGTLPQARPDNVASEHTRPPGEWPEHLQREMDLAIVTTFFSAGIIGLFLWMGGLF
ncbi:hypothetical protein BI364_01970 [Acidihalobacter yilgarnensis]|uniref:Uncharacterized protein n=1 Tax=Acidihalobacter yilgarnensis TaxID=2819280 RepID=A0A1D8IKF1_9GAMM|nr:hypothetical protein [Acidihalobacter yilgarnensis]AOU96938.1 hypothetical protein BI364_01970 [Acidihalobacter yilgarnensis]